MTPSFSSNTHQSIQRIKTSPTNLKIATDDSEGIHYNFFVKGGGGKSIKGVIVYPIHFPRCIIDQRKTLNIDLGNASEKPEQDISSTTNVVENNTTTNVTRVNNFVQQVNCTHMTVSSSSPFGLSM